MKGLILAAGQGSRMAELKLKHKSLAVVNKKHVIDFSLDLLTAVNEGKRLIDSIVVVVGHNAEAIMEYIGNEHKGVPVQYVFQNERKGVAHAIMTAKETINDDFVLCLADEILFNSRLYEMIQEFNKKKIGVLCGVVIDGEDFSMKPIAYDIKESDEWDIRKVREKPEYYNNDFRGIGECIFSKNTLPLLEELKPNQIRGEYEMGDFIQLIIDKGYRAEIFNIADGYMNVNYAKDLIIANTILKENEE